MLVQIAKQVSSVNNLYGSRPSQPHTNLNSKQAMVCNVYATHSSFPKRTRKKGEEECIAANAFAGVKRKSEPHQYVMVA